MTARPRGPGPARRRFGQHFLEGPWVDKLLLAIDPTRDESFIEIGPGLGALTVPLGARARHVLAVEIDRRLASALRCRHLRNVVIRQDDFLRVSAESLLQDSMPALANSGVRVVGNLPYSAASPILFRLIALRARGLPILDAIVMVQREVADRLTAAPGSRQYGVLTILIGQSAQVERLLALPPGAFRPPPKVHSAVVRLRFHDATPPARHPALFVALVRAIFTRRRKTLANALKAFPPAVGLDTAAALTRAGLDGRQRPETLALPELVRLADIFAGLEESRLAAAAPAVL